MTNELRREGTPPRRTIGVRELRARLAAYLARVENGETLIVTNGGRRIARLGPVSEPPGSGMGYGLEDMARLGLVSRPRFEPGSPSDAPAEPGSSTATARPLPVDVRIDRIVRQVRG